MTTHSLMIRCPLSNPYEVPELPDEPNELPEPTPLDEPALPDPLEPNFPDIPEPEPE